MTRRFTLPGSGLPVPSMQWNPLNIQGGVTSELLKRGLKPTEMKLAPQAPQAPQDTKKQPSNPQPTPKNAKPA